MERVNLDALEAALAKATPGEWVRRNSAISACAIDSIAENGNSKYLGEFYGPDWVENAIFIAFAHNALPALIAEVRQLRREAEAAAKAEAVAVKFLGDMADLYATGHEPGHHYTAEYNDALMIAHDKIQEHFAALRAGKGGDA